MKIIIVLLIFLIILILLISKNLKNNFDTITIKEYNDSGTKGNRLPNNNSDAYYKAKGKKTLGSSSDILNTSNNCNYISNGGYYLMLSNLDGILRLYNTNNPGSTASLVWKSSNPSSNKKPFKFGNIGAKLSRNSVNYVIRDNESTIIWSVFDYDNDGIDYAYISSTLTSNFNLSNAGKLNITFTDITTGVSSDIWDTNNNSILITDDSATSKINIPYCHLLKNNKITFSNGSSNILYSTDNNNNAILNANSQIQLRDANNNVIRSFPPHLSQNSNKTYAVLNNKGLIYIYNDNALTGTNYTNPAYFTIMGCADLNIATLSNIFKVTPDSNGLLLTQLNKTIGNTSDTNTGYIDVFPVNYIACNSTNTNLNYNIYYISSTITSKIYSPNTRRSFEIKKSPDPTDSTKVLCYFIMKSVSSGYVDDSTKTPTTTYLNSGSGDTSFTEPYAVISKTNDVNKTSQQPIYRIDNGNATSKYIYLQLGWENNTMYTAMSGLYLFLKEKLSDGNINILRKKKVLPSTATSTQEYRLSLTDTGDLIITNSTSNTRLWTYRCNPAGTIYYYERTITLNIKGIGIGQNQGDYRNIYHTEPDAVNYSWRLLEVGLNTVQLDSNRSWMYIANNPATTYANLEWDGKTSSGQRVTSQTVETSVLFLHDMTRSSDTIKDYLYYFTHSSGMGNKGAQHKLIDLARINDIGSLYCNYFDGCLHNAQGNITLNIGLQVTPISGTSAPYETKVFLYPDNTFVENQKIDIFPTTI